MSRAVSMEMRFRRSIAIVIGLVMLASVLSIAASLSRPSVSAWAWANVPTAIESVGSNSDVDWKLPAEDVVPEAFSREVIDVEHREGVMATSSGAGLIVGWSMDGTADAAMEEVSRELARKGWHCTESGWAACASFTKDEGEMRWLIVSCFEVSGQVSIVIQTAG